MGDEIVEVWKSIPQNLKRFSIFRLLQAAGPIDPVVRFGAGQSWR